MATRPTHALDPWGLREKLLFSRFEIYDLIPSPKRRTDGVSKPEPTAIATQQPAPPPSTWPVRHASSSLKNDRHGSAGSAVALSRDMGQLIRSQAGHQIPMARKRRAGRR
jgi:hypothetical protein